MLRKNKNETYYVVSSNYNSAEKKIITCLIETDADSQFEFIASYEKLLDQDLTANIKKLKGYSFSAKELAALKQTMADETALTINSILAENNMTLEEIDFIGLQNLSLDDDFYLNISTYLYDKFKLPIIFDLKALNKEEFLKLLASTKNLEEGLLINLDDNFDIYKVKSQVSQLDSTIGFSILRYLALYANVEIDQISFLISQGEVDEAIIHKVSQLEDLDSLQKELINLLVFSKITTQDKLRTAFFAIKSLLLKNLAEFDNSTPIMLIGNTSALELINQAIKEKFDNVVFLKNQSQRQNTLETEKLAYYSSKKYALKNYNNGVKLS